MSSANISAHVLVSDKGRLFIYIKKSKGPSTEHCGTPETTAFLSEMAPEK